MANVLNSRAPPQHRPKTQGYWTDVFPNLNDNDGLNSFKQHFRIKRTTFDSLVQRLQTHHSFSMKSPNSIPIERQIAIAIWRLANGAGMRTTEQLLGVSQVSSKFGCI
jgi:hypothetical protein